LAPAVKSTIAPQRATSVAIDMLGSSTMSPDSAAHPHQERQHALLEAAHRLALPGREHRAPDHHREAGELGGLQPERPDLHQRARR